MLLGLARNNNAKDKQEVNNQLSQSKSMMTGIDDVDRVDYRFEAARLNSFVTWNVPDADIRSFAAAGFYYTGKDDILKCFECQLTLSKWTIDDEDPWKYHQRWSSCCKFIRGKPCGNIPIGTDSDLILPSTVKSYDKCGMYGVHYQPNAVADIPVYFGNSNELSKVKYDDLKKSKYPEYANLENRLHTFNTWPTIKTQTKQQLADAGFFYTGHGDRTICYYCGGCLEKWEAHDVPLQEHYRWFPKCILILKKLGQANSDLLIVHTANKIAE